MEVWGTHKPIGTPTALTILVEWKTATRSTAWDVELNEKKKYIKPKDLEQRPLLCFFMFCFDTIKLPGNEKMEIIVIVLAFDGLISVYNMFSATYLSMLT